MKFANIHNHTDLGSFDSILTPGKFVSRLKDIGQEHLVQTEHGTLRGMVNIAQEAQKNGIKYIPGLEAYVTFGQPDKAKDEFSRLYYHMLLIAKDNEGLKNLQRLVALSYQPTHMYYKPRLGLQDIFNHSKGLIATSGCLASLTSCTIMAEADGLEKMNCSQCHILGHPCDDHEVPKDLILDPALKGARALDPLLDQFTKHFRDDFYLELQDSGAGDAQDLVNAALIDAGKRKGLPTIVTSDAHYATPDQAKLRSMVLRIRHGKSAEDSADEGFYDEGRIYLKTGEELAEIFGTEPINNTMDLVNKCNVNLDFETSYFPAPSIPDELVDPSSELKPENRLLNVKAYEGLTALGLVDREGYNARLDMELTTIGELGFSAYFLVLQEILDWCKEQGILVGPGRGSAAGSLVAYALGITNVDPIQYGLFFSRFLNKSRVSWPDSIESFHAEMHGVKFSERKLQCGV